MVHDEETLQYIVCLFGRNLESFSSNFAASYYYCTRVRFMYQRHKLLLGVHVHRDIQSKEACSLSLLNGTAKKVIQKFGETEKMARQNTKSMIQRETGKNDASLCLLNVISHHQEVLAVKSTTTPSLAHTD